MGPGAGNLGRGRLCSVACPKGITAPTFPTGSGMVSGGGQPGEDLLLQGTSSPTELWVPIMETRGTSTSLCCLSYAIHSLQSNSGPALCPCTEDKMKDTAKSAAGHYPSHHSFLSSAKKWCLLRVQASLSKASLLTTLHTAFQMCQAGNVLFAAVKQPGI